MKLTLDLQVLKELVRKNRGVTCWKSLARKTHHNENVFHLYCRAQGEEEAFEHLFKRNLRSRMARRERRIRKELLIHLVRLQRKHGCTPGKPEIEEDGRYTAITYIYHFGSIREAQATAGLIPNGPGTPGHAEVRPRYIYLQPKEVPAVDRSRRMVARVKQLALRLGHTPTYRELKAEKIYYEELYKFFDSAKEMWRLCGLTPNPQGHSPRSLPSNFNSAP